MKSFWSFAAFLFAASAILTSPTIAQSSSHDQASQSLASSVTEPQLVRLSYVEGDVRFNRGDGKRPDLKKPWERAEINLPIEQGFALATGDDGRAEIEFETGGVVYLAENSVVLFNKLASTDDLPETRIELVSGTLTTNVKPIEKEIFAIAAPDGGEYRVVYPESSYVRIDSYLDGVSFTVQANDGSYYYAAGSSTQIPLKKGQTLTYESGRPIKLDGAGQSKAPAGWDDWVAARYAAREANMQAALKASGLSAPIPGLSDLYSSGTFSSCAPYGTCWEPSRQAEETLQSQSPSAAQSSPTLGKAPSAAYQGAPQSRPFIPHQVNFETLVGECPFPLWDGWTELARTPQELEALSFEAYDLQLEQPWSWPVCHYGSWVHQENHYVVVIRRRKRHYPVRWVKVGKQIAFVPPHPNDARLKAPINLKYGTFVPIRQGGGGRIDRISYDPKDAVTILPGPPKEFRAPPAPALASAPAPEIRGRLVDSGTWNPKSTDTKAQLSRITYDYGKGKFVRSGVEIAGRTGKPVVISSLSSRGGFAHPNVSEPGWQRNEGANRGSGGSSHTGNSVSHSSASRWSGGGASASSHQSGGGSVSSHGSGGSGGSMGGGSHGGGGSSGSANSGGAGGGSHSK
jgi:hypothetical protein